MAQQKCENCRFFDPNSPQSEAPYEGYCLRYPPKQEVRQDGYYDNWLFPKVHKNAQCGEWRPTLVNGNISAYHEE